MSLSLNKSVSHFDGDYIPSTIVTLTNRTGGALVEGRLVAINTNFVNTTYDELNPTTTTGAVNPNYLFGAAVACTVNNQFGIMAVAKGAIADGARGQFAITGLHRVLVADGTAAGVFVTGAAGTTAGTVTATQAGLDALAVPTAILGRLLEANASGATAPRLCLINGFMSPISGGGA